MTSESKVNVQLGPRRWELGGDYLKILEPCNQCLEAEDVGCALRNELEEKGYIYLKGILPKESVFNARRAILEHIQQLHETGVLQKPVFSSAYEEGILTSGCAVGCVPFMEGKNSITNHPSVLDVIENPRLYELFTQIFHGIHPVTFDFKWLRGMHHGGNTGCHLDRVYMNRGSSQLLTCWIPLDQITIDMSVLAVLEGSHRLDRSADNGYTKLQATYADMDVDRDRLHGTGWFTEDPMEFYQFNKSHQTESESSSSNPIWKTTAFSAGDILIFTMRTIHMSTINLTNKLRLSCDTRWQPSTDSIDPRFVQLKENTLLGHAETKFGLYAKDVEKIPEEKTTMEQWREKWGFSSKFNEHNTTLHC